MAAACAAAVRLSTGRWYRLPECCQGADGPQMRQAARDELPGPAGDIVLNSLLVFAVKVD